MISLVLSTFSLYSWFSETPNVPIKEEESEDKKDKKGGLQMIGSEFPLSEDGRTYHLQTKKGEVANRIICVGDLQRAEKYSEFLDKSPEPLKIPSTRGFLTITGYYKGVRVSIIGTGMGTPMIDFTIRENLAIIEGKVAMIRLGTCGTPSDEIEPGDIAVQSSAVLVRRNSDGFRKGSKEPTYTLSNPVSADEKLTKLLKENISKTSKTFEGLGATADSFYSSQGRVTSEIDDRNEDLIDGKLLKKYPKTIALEMETFHLYDLSDCSKGRLISSSACLVLAQRRTHKFIDLELKHKKESELGLAGLETISKIEL